MKVISLLSFVSFCTGEILVVESEGLRHSCVVQMGKYMKVSCQNAASHKQGYRECISAKAGEINSLEILVLTGFGAQADCPKASILLTEFTLLFPHKRFYAQDESEYKLFRNADTNSNMKLRSVFRDALLSDERVVGKLGFYGRQGWSIVDDSVKDELESAVNFLRALKLETLKNMCSSLNGLTQQFRHSTVYELARFLYQLGESGNIGARGILVNLISCLMTPDEFYGIEALTMGFEVELITK